MGKGFKVTVECRMSQQAAVDFIKDIYRRREITPADTLELQRELRDQAKGEKK